MDRKKNVEGEKGVCVCVCVCVDEDERKKRMF